MYTLTQGKTLNEFRKVGPTNNGRYSNRFWWIYNLQSLYKILEQSYLS